MINRHDWKRLWCWERLRAGIKEGDRGWDGWMASTDKVDLSLGRLWEIMEFREAWHAAIQSSSVQPLSCVQLSETPWIAAHQASLSITNSLNVPKLMSIESISVVPFSSHLQSFPASGSFPMSQFFASGGQSIGASAEHSINFILNITPLMPM